VWTVNARALRELRVGRSWTLERLEKISGVSLRTLRALEAEDRTARDATVAYLAKAFEVDPAELACAIDGAPEPSRRRRAGRIVTPGSGRATGEVELPPPSRLDHLADFERSLEPLAPLLSRGELVPPLDVARYRDLHTDYAAYAGAVSYVAGRIGLQSVITHEEAAPLGTRRGIGVRFYLARPIADGRQHGLTVYTAGADDTRSLQRTFGEPVLLVVRVVLAPETLVADAGGFACFMSERRRPWTLRVERIVDGDPPLRGKPS
jgi:transcriptional regulator with XRE-family HTH domain